MLNETIVPNEDLYRCHLTNGSLYIMKVHGFIYREAYEGFLPLVYDRDMGRLVAKANSERSVIVNSYSLQLYIEATVRKYQIKPENIYSDFIFYTFMFDGALYESV